MSSPGAEGKPESKVKQRLQKARRRLSRANTTIGLSRNSEDLSNSRELPDLSEHLQPAESKSPRGATSPKRAPTRKFSSPFMNKKGMRSAEGLSASMPDNHSSGSHKKKKKDKMEASSEDSSEGGSGRGRSTRRLFGAGGGGRRGSSINLSAVPPMEHPDAWVRQQRDPDESSEGAYGDHSSGNVSPGGVSPRLGSLEALPSSPIRMSGYKPMPKGVSAGSSGDGSPTMHRRASSGDVGTWSPEMSTEDGTSEHSMNAAVANILKASPTQEGTEKKVSSHLSGLDRLANATSPDLGQFFAKVGDLSSIKLPGALSVPGTASNSSSADSSPSSTLRGGRKKSRDSAPSSRKGSSRRRKLKLACLREYVESDNTEEISELLVKDSRLVLVAACFCCARAHQLNSLAMNVVVVFETHHKSIKLMRWGLRNEVLSTTRSEQLFREDSISSKLMGAYAQLVATKFLKQMILPVLSKIQSGKELDDSRVVKVTAALVKMIIKEINTCPFQLRVMCFYIRLEVEKKFRDRAAQSIGSFIFLRFLCPALVAPERYMVVDKEPPLAQRKQLVKVSTAMQRLVNYVNTGDMPGKASSQMAKFITSTAPKLEKYLEAIATKTLPTEAEGAIAKVGLLHEEEVAALVNVCSFLKGSISEVEQVLSDENFA